MKGIIATEEFFRSLGMLTSFHEYNIPTNEIDKMLDRILFRGDDNTIGVNGSPIVRMFRQFMKWLSDIL